MTDLSFPVTEALARDGGEGIPLGKAARRVRRLARLGVAAQVTFVASWLLAAAWQGPGTASSPTRSVTCTRSPRPERPS